MEQALNSARDSGLAALEEICTRHRSMYDMAFEDCYRYLSDNLHFQLGPQERSGLDLYFEYLKNQDIISQDLNLQFHDCQTT